KAFLQDSIDDQRYINYLRTQAAYTLKNSRYDQWIGSIQNVRSQSTQQIWADPLNQQGMLTFDESQSGIVPREIRPPELSGSLHMQYQQATEDIYSTSGVFPAQLGRDGNEQSGVALDIRQSQGSM